MFRVAIHQPNFMPWYPFFQKIYMSDIFVLLNTAQYVKGNYHNRFNIGKQWYTMPVNKQPAFQALNEKQYIDPTTSWNAIKRRLPQYEHILNLFDDCISTSLIKTNSTIIQKICHLLELPTVITVDWDTGYSGVANLLQICKTYNAYMYVAGPSTVHYFTPQDHALFEANGVKIKLIRTDMQVQKPILEVLNNALR